MFVKRGDKKDISFEECADMRVKIGQKDNSTEISVSFLVTTQKINCTVLGFNGIKYLL